MGWRPAGWRQGGRRKPYGKGTEEEIKRERRNLVALREEVEEESRLIEEEKEENELLREEILARQGNVKKVSFQLPSDDSE